MENNTNVDAFSRLPVESGEILNVLIGEDPIQVFNIYAYQRQDPELEGIFEQLNNDIGAPPFTIRDDILYYHKYDGHLLVVIPRSLIVKILSLYHAHEMSVHMSRDRLYALLKKRFYWKGMFGDVDEWIKACPKCNEIKTNKTNNFGLLQPIIVTKPFEIVAADTMGPLTTSSEGYKYLNKLY